MNPLRAVGLILLLAGMFIGSWGAYEYFDQRKSIEIGDSELVIEGRKMPAQVFIGGSMFIAGAVLVIAGGNGKK